MKKIWLIVVAFFTITILAQLSVAEAGWVTCNVCYGTGNCHDCDGKGWVEVWDADLLEYEKITCRECHGTGDCWLCDGAGRIRD